MTHEHDHDFTQYHRAFALGVALNVFFVIIELVYGLLNGSLALLADAGHNFSDVLSLLLAWGAGLLAAKAATEKRTYGFRKATVMAALTSAVLLLAALTGITWKAVQRLLDPQPVPGDIVIIVAGIGVLINTATALLFISGQKHDLNIKGAFLHMAADAGVSLGVVIAGVVIMTTGWLWVDPAISLFIVVVILIGTWTLFRDSLNLALDAVPRGVDLTEIRDYLTSFDKVVQTHHLHVWALSTTETALTVHLVSADEHLDNAFLQEVQQGLKDRFGIAHATIQVEQQCQTNECMLENE